MHVWPWEKGRCFWRIKKKLNKTIPACGFLFSLLRFPQEPGRYTFIGKMVFQRKSNASPINLWNKILGQFKLRVFTTENIYSTRVIYDLWTCGCIDEYKRELRQHLKLWLKFASFPPVWTPKMISQWQLFKRESNFTLRKRAMNFLTTTLPLRAYLFTFNIFVTVIINLQNGFSVGNYSLKCSYFSWNKSL